MTYLAREGKFEVTGRKLSKCGVGVYQSESRCSDAYLRSNIIGPGYTNYVLFHTATPVGTGTVARSRIQCWRQREIPISIVCFPDAATITPQSDTLSSRELLFANGLHISYGSGCQHCHGHRIDKVVSGKPGRCMHRNTRPSRYGPNRLRVYLEESTLVNNTPSCSRSRPD
jgi:hypothetical protein